MLLPLVPFSGCAIYQTVWLQKENATVMLGVNVAQIYRSDGALNLKWLQYL